MTIVMTEKISNLGIVKAGRGASLAARCASSWVRSKRNLPMRSGWLVRVENVPYPSQRENREAVGETNRHGTPSRFRCAVESHRGLRIGMTWSTLAGFKCLDSCLHQNAHGGRYSLVEMGE